MELNQTFLSNKRKYLFILLLLLLVSITYAVFGMKGNEDFDMSKRVVLLRKVGHELLLQSGDKKSRVLPVNQITENEYQLSFEKELTFQPDSVVDLTRRLLRDDPFASDYVVNVMNSVDSTVVYGYAISKNTKDDIVACRGREQPRGLYVVNIKFKPTAIDAAKKGYLLGSLPLLAFVGFLFLKSTRTKKTIVDREQSHVFTLGTVLFDAKNRTLNGNGKTTELTGTETRVLLVFAMCPNEPIERSRLQKEIWEDEGVIVGRSLDMFISKLRKKLELDPNIKIAVIRGKGYKLEINH